MYSLVRPFLFNYSAEQAHDLTMSALQKLNQFKLDSAVFPFTPKSDSVEVMGLTFPNRVGLAAGLDKTGACIDPLGKMGFGAIEIGTLTPKPQSGNPQPRLFRVLEHEGIINRMGFNNPGIAKGIENVQKSTSFQKNGGILGINIGKNKVTPNEDAISDYLICYQEAYAYADYITVNLSSPNTPGLRDLQSADTAARLIARLKEEESRLEKEHGRKVPLALKVAPDLQEDAIKELAGVFKKEGLDALIATNTTIDRTAIAGHKLEEEAGGLSGAPVTQKSTEVIKAFYAELGESLPIIGVGGIMNGQDAVDKLEAGAKLIQVYSGLIYQGADLVHDCIRKTRKA